MTFSITADEMKAISAGATKLRSLGQRTEAGSLEGIVDRLLDEMSAGATA